MQLYGVSTNNADQLMIVNMIGEYLSVKLQRVDGVAERLWVLGREEVK